MRRDMRFSIALTIATVGTMWACSSTPSSSTVTAESAAAKVGLTQFIGCGPGSNLTSITDTGYGYLRGTRVKILVFTSNSARDNWLQTAGAALNITPLTFGISWVAYISPDQKTKGCD